LDHSVKATQRTCLAETYVMHSVFSRQFMLVTHVHDDYDKDVSFHRPITVQHFFACVLVANRHFEMSK